MRKRSTLCSLEVQFRLHDPTKYANIRGEIRRLIAGWEDTNDISVEFIAIDTKEVLGEPRRKSPPPYKYTDEELHNLLHRETPGDKGDHK